MNRDFLPKTFDKKLTHAMEECAEFIVACAKAQRFGLYASNPLLPMKQKHNAEHIREEALDVICAIQRLLQENF